MASQSVMADEARNRLDTSEMDHLEDTDLGEDLLFVPMARAMASGLQSLDVVDLVQVFEVKARVMRSIPKFMRGVFRGAMKVGLLEITKGKAANNVIVESRGWKLFMLLPRLLLSRQPRGGLVPKGRLKERVQKFCAGEWISLLEASLDGALAGQSAQAKRRRCQKDTKERRAERALGLAQMGKLSNARQALEGAAIAPGDENTWKALSNEDKRPKQQRFPLDEGVFSLVPSDPLALDVDLLFKTLRSAKKGSVGGPSGMTVEHPRQLLESGVCTTLLGEVATQFARGHVPEEVLPAVRLGKMTAFQKPDGGVRGIVVGDVFRRLVARTLAKQFAEQAQVATHPFQYALSTRAGTECVAHVVQTLTSQDRSATILSIDGVGAYDSISRRAMFRGLMDMVDGEKLVPFVRLFYNSPSTYIWEDDVGEVRHVCQGEGGEQGDPLMPLLFSVGQHRAMVSVQAALFEGERLFAFLDDIYVVCSPSRIGEVHALIQRHLWELTGIRVHHGKTKIWNSGGVKPPAAVVLTARAHVDHPTALVWRGDPMLDVSKQGLNVLGVPVGHPQYVEAQLDHKGAEQAVLFERIPWIDDVQVAWLLLTFCAATRAN